MSSPLRDPKDLPEWHELDYFRRPRPLRRLRWRVSLAILLVSAAAVALLVWFGQPTLFQARPVSQAHAMFNDDCRLCHTEVFQTPKRLSPLSVHAQSVTDPACASCHPGPDHNPVVTATDCADCHKEHRGRTFLVQVADRYCTRCHAHLGQQFDAACQRAFGRPCGVPDVSGFAPNQHPDFLLWNEPKPTDPGTVRFSHAAHLKKDGIPGPNREVRKLDCASCHETDADRMYMRPVNYRKHCAECHALSVQVVGEFVDPKTQRAADELSKQPAPHEAPATVGAALQDRYAEFFRSHKNVETKPEVPRPIPGQPPPPEPPSTEEGWVKEQINAAERLLFQGGGGCRYCHQVVRPWQPGRLPQYAPAGIPTRWLVHSRFSHDSHRPLACTECHAGAAESRRSQDVLMPHVDTCEACHSRRVGARTDCVECHRFHDRSREAGWKGTHTIRELTGAAPFRGASP